VSYLESIQLHIGISVCEAFDHALGNLPRAILVAADTIAHLHDRAPVLRCEVLVRRLGCDRGDRLAYFVYYIPSNTDGDSAGLAGKRRGHTDGIVERARSGCSEHDDELSWVRAIAIGQ
jgi:hypothetical protein